MKFAPRPKPKTDGYVNQHVSRDGAVDFCLNAGLLIQHKQGAAPRIELRPRGEGYDALLPVECLAALFQAGVVVGISQAKGEGETCP